MKYTNPTFQKEKKPRKGYRLRLAYKDSSGNRRFITKLVGVRTMAEAKNLLYQWQADLNREAEEAEARAAERGCTKPIAELVREHIDRAVNTGAIEKSTVIGYNAALRHIREGFGDLPVCDLTRDMVEQWEEDMTASGLSSSTVGKAHRLLKMVLTRAVDADLIPKNPMALVKPPKRKAVNPGINALDKATRARVMELLDMMQPCRMSTAAKIALHTGMRRAEICALRWQDVDLQGGVLWVRRSIGVAKGGPYLKEAKTGKDRDIALTPTIVKVLKEWKANQPDGCVYVLGDQLGYWDPAMLSKEWMNFVKQFGINGTEGRPCTFHDLRHTWATAAVAAGVDIKTVSSNLGHANAAMTLNIYASADPEAKRRAAQLMDSVI